MAKFQVGGDLSPATEFEDGIVDVLMILQSLALGKVIWPWKKAKLMWRIQPHYWKLAQWFMTQLRTDVEEFDKDFWNLSEVGFLNH